MQFSSFTEGHSNNLLHASNNLKNQGLSPVVQAKTEKTKEKEEKSNMLFIDNNGHSEHLDFVEGGMGGSGVLEEELREKEDGGGVVDKEREGEKEREREVKDGRKNSHVSGLDNSAREGREGNGLGNKKSKRKKNDSRKISHIVGGERVI